MRYPFIVNPYTWNDDLYIELGSMCFLHEYEIIDSKRYDLLEGHVSIIGTIMEITSAL